MAIYKRCFGLVLSLTGLLLLGACSSEDEGLPYNREEMKTVMSELDETADVIWGNSGSEWDEQGERELYPTTDAGWDALATAANQMVIIGQDLKGRIDSDDPRAEAWLAYADGISAVSQKLVTAAEEHDKKATFDEGGVLYQACTACHATFPAPEEVEERRPQQGPAGSAPQ